MPTEAPEILKQAIPGCEEFTKNSDTEFTAKATNKIQISLKQAKHKLSISYT